MDKSLVIVESPAKAKTLEKFLGPGFTVLASVGHIKNLPENTLGVDIEKGFEPVYDTIPGKGEILKKIKAQAKKADHIYLAPDPDREGEAIAFHLAQEIGQDAKVQRVLFHEIVKSAVQQAIAHPRPLDTNKYNSQQARRVLDRLMGYLISPLLWDKIRRGLSAGRVQSVAVKLVVDREREILRFVPEEYWSLHSQVEGSSPPPFECRLHRKDGGHRPDVGSAAEAERIRQDILRAQLTVTEVTRKERKKNPAPPFITSTLQQEAARKLHYSARKTMKIAQDLYEGVELGSEGPVGLITYMRTDSTRLSEESLREVRGFIGQTWGDAYLPEKARYFKNRKSTQDAHEAIRVSSVARTPDSVRQWLSSDQAALYELIWKRFVACQMASAVFDAMTVDIAAGPHVLRATGSTLKFPGFISVYIEGNDQEASDGEDDEGRILPPLSEGSAVRLLDCRADQHFTQPPPRFTEASLIRELEEKGIGRPSTYASIMGNIQERKYVERDAGRFKPTELGVLVTDMLVEQFPRLFSEEFTASMEEQLDQIEEGGVPWREVLQRYYGELHERLEAAKAHMKDLKKSGQPTDFKCEKCGSPMVLKWGRNGQFLACTGFPECKNTLEVRLDIMGKILVETPEEIADPCPQCGSKLMVKRGRFGKFLACTNYPECKYTNNYQKAPEPSPSGESSPRKGPAVGEIVGACTTCGRPMMVKKSRFGLFLACTGYPECKATQRLPRKGAPKQEQGEAGPEATPEQDRDDAAAAARIVARGRPAASGEGESASRKAPAATPAKKGTQKKAAASTAEAPAAEEGAAARKSAGKGAAAKKSAGKGAAAKKSAGKEETARKSAGKGAAAKKSAGKGAAAKKSAGKGAAAKKSAGKGAAEPEQKAGAAAGAAPRTVLRRRGGAGSEGA